MLTTSIVNIACTIFNLLILYFLFRKFLFGRVDKVLMQRREEVDTATKAADEATKSAIATKREYEKKIEMADEEKEQILADIKKQGYDEYEKIIVEARHNAEIENERAKEAYAAQLTDMVVDAASKIAATKHSKEDDMELYEKFISEAGANNE